MISLKRLRASKRQHELSIIEQHHARMADALLKEICSMTAEAKRIRGLPRDEVDALIKEMTDLRCLDERR